MKEKSTIKRFMRGFVSGNVLSQPEVKRLMPYALFLAFLMLLYIGNGYRMQRLQRRYSKLNSEVKELRTKSLSINEMRMTATRRSEIIKALQERGIELEESVVPPKVIE